MKARSLAACSAELHHATGRDPHLARRPDEDADWPAIAVDR
jgi:hypothetical protein